MDMGERDKLSENYAEKKSGNLLIAPKLLTALENPNKILNLNGNDFSLPQRLHPILQLPFAHTEMPETSQPQNPNHTIPLSEVKLVSHCYSIHLLILGKILLTTTFLILLGKIKFLLYLLTQCLEIFGYFGSRNLNNKQNLIFILYLQLNIFFRIFTCIFKSAFIELSNEYNEDDLTMENYGELSCYEKYVFASVLFVVYECIQIVCTVELMRKILGMAESIKEEMIFVIKLKKIPKFICLGKIKSRY